MPVSYTHLDVYKRQGLAGVVTDEMADVALKMKVRKPMTLSELVKATGKPAGHQYSGSSAVRP